MTDLLLSPTVSAQDTFLSRRRRDRAASRIRATSASPSPARRAFSMSPASHRRRRSSILAEPGSEMNETLSQYLPRPTPKQAAEPIVGSYALAFDIDGVLMRSGDPIPVAPEALRMLNGDNEYNVRVPYIFVTNGGGKTEEQRCKEFSEKMETPVSPNQFIQGHTPMRELRKKYGTVLVVGGIGEACRQVAEQYGFADVVTPGDILKWNPNVCPFRTLTDEEHKNSRYRDFSQVKIEAILVFADSRDWAADQQIILDLLLSKDGVMGTVSETYEEGPPLYFAHNDFVWATNYDQSRYGMGALQVSISALYKAHTNKELFVTKYGKPNYETFKYANNLLAEWREKIFGHKSDPTTVYFVGDTPESDIQFANKFDDSWHSILVKTGVYQEGTVPKHKPKVIVDNVLEAVKYVLEREHGVHEEEYILEEDEEELD
ncbi:hypothetical protein CANCADRAFT_31269 [Tortispora caseinolytica NRRL Y-17796]|uniref:TIGR01456 family HAD hydrolase n=1 Tax=Tortispora caseinolytica NRRL Y-17796 TaxID=767744 RepID=A0A1E4TER0_9ASCO|nr:hypothetical protein CANCADRAFT_31269 [Tortispora caseinolytica NRRL Y-17796]